LVEDDAALEVRHFARKLPAAIDGARVHHDRLRLGQIEMFQLQAVKAKVLAGGKRRLVLALELDAQHHDHIAVADGGADVIGQPHAGRELFELRRQQRSRTAQHDLGAELAEQVNITAGHAAVRNIADDGDTQAVQPAGAVEDGSSVKQRLSRVL